MADYSLVPNEPTFSVSSQPNQVVLTFGPAIYGMSPTSYNIYKGGAPGYETFLVNTTSTSYIDTSVTNSFYAHYRVSAVNSYGEGPLTGSRKGRFLVSTVTRGTNADYVSGGSGGAGSNAPTYKDSLLENSYLTDSLFGGSYVTGAY
jgi:hypothetical protein